MFPAAESDFLRLLQGMQVIAGLDAPKSNTLIFSPIILFAL